MAANESKLGALHDKVADVLTKALDGQQLPTGEQDDDGNEIMQTMEPSAAIITSAIQFLKNNNITCTPAQDNKLGELEEKLKARRAKLKPGASDFAAAKEQVGFLSGLPN